MIEVTILVVSIILNVFLFLYLRWLLKNFTFLSESMQSLLESADAFSGDEEQLEDLFNETGTTEDEETEEEE